MQTTDSKGNTLSTRPNGDGTWHYAKVTMGGRVIISGDAPSEADAVAILSAGKV